MRLHQVGCGVVMNTVHRRGHSYPQAMRFSAEDVPEKPLKKPSVLYRPLVKLAAFFYTHPKLVKKWFHGVSHMMSPEHLKLFEPIQPVSFKSLDQTPLQGYWMPADKPSTKTVVIGHGYTADWREVIAVADPLREKGYNCFLFDFRAHGASGGKKTSLGFHEAKDLAAAIDTVKTVFKEESSKVYYLGHSMGAAAMLMAPKSLESFPEAWAKLNNQVSGIILDAPYYRFRDIVERFIKGASTVNSTNWLDRHVTSPLMKGKFGDRVLDGLQWMVKDYLKVPVDLFGMTPAQVFAKSSLVQKPVLVLHGDKDYVTPYEHGVKVFNTLKAANPGKTEMVTLEGAEHLNRSWDPANKNDAFWTAQRSTLNSHVQSFLQRISFKGRESGEAIFKPFETLKK